MSMYRAKPGTLKAVKVGNVWEVWDNYGPYDGPYLTEGECIKYITDHETKPVRYSNETA